MLNPSLAVNAPPDPRIDGCPRCVTNTEAPRATYTFRDRVVAFYRCADCGHRWHTSWAVA